MNNDRFISTKETRKLLGVTTKTLVNWDKAGKINTIKSPSGIRLYSLKDIQDILGCSVPIEPKKKIAYCRVSSQKQKDDLERQKDLFKHEFPDYIVVEDIASGINWKRKGLKTILEQAMSGDISDVVVAHRDRLCRFGFELVEWILESNGVKLTVLDRENTKSPDEELTDDILSIIHVYSCRKMGRRRYTLQADSIVPKEESEDDV
jgi:predicted site-specific integrase-resolvase